MLSKSTALLSRGDALSELNEPLDALPEMVRETVAEPAARFVARAAAQIKALRRFA